MKVQLSILFGLAVGNTFFGAKIYPYLYTIFCGFFGLFITAYLFTCTEPTSENEYCQSKSSQTLETVGYVLGVVIGVAGCFFCYRLKKLQAFVLGLQVGLACAEVTYLVLVNWWIPTMKYFFLLYILAWMAGISYLTFSKPIGKILVNGTAVIGANYFNTFLLLTFPSFYYSNGYFVLILLYSLGFAGFAFLGRTVQRHLGYDITQEDLDQAESGYKPVTNV